MASRVWVIEKNLIWFPITFVIAMAGAACSEEPFHKSVDHIDLTEPTVTKVGPNGPTIAPGAPRVTITVRLPARPPAS